MPGSIQISVLDFKDLPSSSNSVKFSLGKVEHEAEENETLSFPLTNLRDNLIITVQDAEGNRVSQSGVRTVSIIEKSTWDDVFPIEGGGLVHMKMQFVLSDEDRNRIRLMRESAMRKKQAEILGSRHEVSDVLSASSSKDVKRSRFNTEISLKASESCDEIKEESFQGQSFTVKDYDNSNVTDKREETLFPHMPNSSNNSVEKLFETLKKKMLNDVKETNKESTLNMNNVILPRQARVPEKVLQDTKIIEDKNPSFVKRMSKESKLPPFSSDLTKRLQDSPKLAGEMDKQGSPPQNIKKMISVFESTISQDRVPLKSASTKSYRFDTSRLLKGNTLKDHYDKSETLSSSRLRNSFSTGDLRENLSNIITIGDQVDFDNTFLEPTENMQSKGNELTGAEKIEKEALNNEGVNNEKESINGRKTSKVNLDYFDQEGSGQWAFLDEKRHICMTAQGVQEKLVASLPEFVVKGDEIGSPRGADVEDSNGIFGQAMKIALVVGFGVLALLFRQRESGKGKKKENIHALRNQVFMNT